MSVDDELRDLANRIERTESPRFAVAEDPWPEELARQGIYRYVDAAGVLDGHAGKIVATRTIE